MRISKKLLRSRKIHLQLQISKQKIWQLATDPSWTFLPRPPPSLNLESDVNKQVAYTYITAHLVIVQRMHILYCGWIYSAVKPLWRLVNLYIAVCLKLFGKPEWALLVEVWQWHYVGDPLLFCGSIQVIFMKQGWRNRAEWLCEKTKRKMLERNDGELKPQSHSDWMFLSWCSHSSAHPFHGLVRWTTLSL